MERCAFCNHVDRFDWHVPDAIWKTVLLREHWGRVVCLSCFDALAKYERIAYAAHLAPILYFAGHEGRITWRRVIATEAEYEAGLARVSALMDAAPDSPEEAELRVLAYAVDEYEQIHYPIGPPAPAHSAEGEREDA